MNKGLQSLIDQIDKKVGKGAIINLHEIDQEIKRVPSGSLSLDIALGGGYPEGRIVEIYGPESSGKTTLVIHSMIEAQKKYPDRIVGFVDMEHAFDYIYAQNLGLDISEDRFVIAQPDTGEDALEVADAFVRSNQFSIVALDSIASMIPKAELQGDYGESKMGLQARLMGQAMRRLAGSVNKSKVVFYLTNQLRENIGVMFGNPETTPGGNAVKYYASVRLDIRRKAINKDKDGDATSNHIKVKVIKNKTAPPFREAEFNIVYGEGIDKCNEILNLAVTSELVKKAGSWYSYNDTKLGQGEDASTETLKDNPELFEELDEKIREIYF